MADFDVSKIKVVFMDIGGVLLTNGWGHESRQKAAKEFGFDYEEMNILHNFIYNVFEIGSISLDDYLLVISESVSPIHVFFKKHYKLHK